MASIHRITTPRGVIETTITADGSIRAEIRWNPGFGADQGGRFNRAQVFVDNEVLKFCSERVPLRTGMLERSGVLGTVIGSGQIRYIAPYARHQYYLTGTSRAYDANRGAKWFERGKAAEKNRILEGARRIAAGVT